MDRRLHFYDFISFLLGCRLSWHQPKSKIWGLRKSYSRAQTRRPVHSEQRREDCFLHQRIQCPGHPCLCGTGTPHFSVEEIEGTICIHKFSAHTLTHLIHMEIYKLVFHIHWCSQFFNQISYIIGGRVFTLNDMENGVLRANRKPIAALRRPFSRDDPRYISNTSLCMLWTCIS